MGGSLKFNNCQKGVNILTNGYIIPASQSKGTKFTWFLLLKEVDLVPLACEDDITHTV